MNAFPNGITVRRTDVAEWKVYDAAGIVQFTKSSRVAATKAALGLSGGNAAQTARHGAGSFAGEVQVITLADFDGTDSFALLKGDTNVSTAAFVRGTNATAADLQTALRTLTGDTTLTVTGTTDEGPFTVTWVSQTNLQHLLKQGAVSGCTLTVARSSDGGLQ